METSAAVLMSFSHVTPLREQLTADSGRGGESARAIYRFCFLEPPFDETFSESACFFGRRWLSSQRAPICRLHLLISLMSQNSFQQLPDVVILPPPNTVNCQSIVCQPQAFSRAFCFSIQSVITLESVLNCLLNWTAIILPRIPSDEPHTSSKFTAAPVSSSWWTSVSSHESSSFCFCFFGLEFSVVFEVGNILQL